MNITILGTGYVGLPSGVGLAEIGHNVVCIDRETSKIDMLSKGKITLYEEGLEELLLKNLQNGKIRFTTSIAEGLKNAELIIIAVGTPPHPVTKEADMKYIHAAAIELAPYLKKYTVVAIKSTVPVGTGDSVESLIKKQNPEAQFDVISVPEFLREGYAVFDFFNPDRIIIGTNSEKAKTVMGKVYKYFENITKILYVKRRSSELIKYASNSFLAVKIHYINEMADFCEKSGVDIFEVAQGMGLDSRIGNKFLIPGPGYGGSCFPKDTLAMSYMAKINEVDLSLINAAITGNENRKKNIAKKILSKVKHIRDSKIAVLGLAFKNGTDDCRESPAIEIIAELIENNAKIMAYDPEALENAKTLLGDKIQFAHDMYEAIKDADMLVILTEWPIFSSLDLSKAETLMKQKLILDFRNMLNQDEVIKFGFNYCGVGRKLYF